MFSRFFRRSAGLALILILVSAPLNPSWAQSLSLDGPATLNALESKHAAIRLQPQPRPRPRCNVKRRMLIGAAVGFASGMVVVRKAAKANDGVAGAKTTWQAGGYGAALGAFIGLATCRP
jgi:hypothetical protein